jgi:hypothetical protein
MSIRVSNQVRSTLRSLLAVLLLSAAIGFITNSVGCSNTSNNAPDGSAHAGSDGGAHDGGDGAAGHDGAMDAAGDAL